MSNFAFNWVFQLQPQQITINSPQDNQSLNLFVYPTQRLPTAEELQRCQMDANSEVQKQPTKSFLQIINVSNQHDKKPMKKGWDPLAEHDKKEGRGRPSKKIDHDKILELKTANFTNKKIAEILGTNERQIYRILKRIKGNL